MEAQTSENEVEAVVQERYYEWILRQMRTYRMVKCNHCGLVMYRPPRFIIPTIGGKQ